NAALVNSGYVVPPRRITINLSPADIRKEGTAFDLPIALGLLVATGQIDSTSVEQILAVGELGLDGSLRGVRGVLPVAARVASMEKPLTLLVPPANAAEAALAGPPTCAPATLLQTVDF